MGDYSVWAVTTFKSAGTLVVLSKKAGKAGPQNLAFVDKNNNKKLDFGDKKILVGDKGYSIRQIRRTDVVEYGQQINPVLKRAADDRQKLYLIISPQSKGECRFRTKDCREVDAVVKFSPMFSLRTLVTSAGKRYTADELLRILGEKPKPSGPGKVGGCKSYDIQALTQRTIPTVDPRKCFYSGATFSTSALRSGEQIDVTISNRYGYRWPHFTGALRILGLRNQADSIDVDYRVEKPRLTSFIHLDLD